MRRPNLAGLGLLTVLLSTPLSAAGPGAETLDDAWARAVKAGDVEALVALYAPDAVVFPPDAMALKGRDAIRASWIALFSANTVTDARFTERSYKTSGDVSTGWGRFSMTLQPKAGGAPMTMEGRFTEVAVKKGGKWLYAVDHASTPLPPPPK